MSLNAIKYHTTLADYFSSKPLYLDDADKKKPNVRKLVELPWQQTKVEMWDEVEKTLCDLLFIEAKCQVGFTQALIEDYFYSLNKYSDVGTNDRWRTFARFVQVNSDIFFYRSDLVLSQAANEPDGSPVEQAARTLLDTNCIHRPWLRLINKNKTIGPCLMTIVCSSQVLSVDVSRDDHYLAVGGSDGYVTLFSLPSGRHYRRFHCETSDIQTLRFSVNGKSLITGSSKGEIASWDLTGRSLWRISLPSAVNSLAVTDEWLVAAIGDRKSDNSGAVVLINVHDGNVVISRAAHAQAALDVVFTPNENQVVSGGMDCVCTVWNIPKLTIANNFHEHTNVVFSVANELTDGNIVSAARNLSSDTIEIFVWDIYSACVVQRVSEDTAKKNWMYIKSVIQARESKGSYFVNAQVSPCRCYSVITYGNKGIPGTIIVAAATSEQNYFKGHTDAVTSLSFYKHTPILVTGSLDGTIRLWEMDLNKNIPPVKGHGGEIVSMRFCHDGRRLLTGATRYEQHYDVHSVYPEAALWDLSTYNLISFVQGKRGYLCDVWESQDGQLLFLNGCYRDGSAIGDIVTNKEILFLGRDEHCRAIAASPCGRYIVGGVSSDGNSRINDSIGVFNANTSALYSLFKHEEMGHCRRATFSQDSRWIITAGYKSSPFVCDLVKSSVQKLDWTSFGNEGDLKALSISVDGSLVAGACGQRIFIWTNPSGKFLHYFDVPFEVTSLHFLSCGVWLAVGGKSSRGGQMDIWDGKIPRCLSSAIINSEVTAITSQRDRVATGLEDSRFLIWKLEGQHVPEFVQSTPIKDIKDS
jgi:WD40 repeat protein